MDSVAAVQSEMGELSGKVSDVVASVGSLESEVRDSLRQQAQGGGPQGEAGAGAGPHGDAAVMNAVQVEETLGRVREQLEGRLANLEEKMQSVGASVGADGKASVGPDGSVGADGKDSKEQLKGDDI